MFLSICGCCGAVETGPVTIRCFACGDGSMNWEHRNFYTTAKSPDNTLWGYGVRKLTPSGYSRRDVHALPITSGGTQPGGSAWPAKTNPSSYGSGTSTIAIDLVKITSGGGKSILVDEWVSYTGTRNASFGTIWSDFPIGTYRTERPSLYHATDAGLVLPNVSAFPPGSTYGTASVVIEDPAINGDVLKFRIRPSLITKHASAGSNDPKWFFRRASTNASFPLYGTAAEVVTALESLPGIASVTATGGPCCRAEMRVEVTWSNPANTFSDAWITYSSVPTVTARIVTDWNTGGPTHILGVTPLSFTTDGDGIIAENFSRRNLTSPSGTPFGSSGSALWTFTGFNSLTQTNERTKVGVSTSWLPVPKEIYLMDIRDGVMLMCQTRSRVPVVEPSGSAMTTHATVDDSTGSVIATHDAHLNPAALSWLTESGEIAAYGAQYGYRYQGGDEGSFPPSGNSFDSSLGVFLRSHSGRNFATGTGSLFEPFATEGVVRAASDSFVFAANSNSDDLSARTSGFEWNFETIGERSATQNYSAGRYVDCRWTSFAVGTPDPVLPAHKRESWLTYSSPEWFYPPADLEYRYVHRSGGSNVKTTAWLTLAATATDVETELQAWYGEPIPGYPTISIGGTVEEHDWQTQPFWMYMPLAHISIWTDATGATFAPEGRVLGLEFRNGEGNWKRTIACMDRATGSILWQKNAGLMDGDYPISGGSEGDPVGGHIQVATDSQVVISTLCLPVVQDDVVLGDCMWEWDGTDWTLLTDNCSAISEAVPPADPGTTPGEQQAGTCELI